MKKILSLGLILAIVVSFSFSDTDKAEQPGQWVILGKRVVNIKADHDEIPVTITKGTFKKIKFKVLDAPIYVNNFRVIYGNGTFENFVVNKRFQAGHESRVIDLEGVNRIIKKININYKTLKVGQGKAKVVVFGKH